MGNILTRRVDADQASLQKRTDALHQALTDFGVNVVDVSDLAAYPHQKAKTMSDEDKHKMRDWHHGTTGKFNGIDGQENDA